MNIRSEILNNLQSVPSIPAVAARITVMLRDPNVCMQQVVETLKYDPALTAKVLRLANSAYYGSTRSSTTLKSALVRLGTRRLFHLVYLSSVGTVLSLPLAGYKLERGDLWRHSVAVGIAAEKFEEVLGGRDGDLAFTAGILHDLGKLALSVYVEQYLDLILLEADQRKLTFESSEKAVLGIDHTEVGSELLEMWGFPPELITVAKWHHDTEHAAGHRHLVDLVHVADITAMMMGVGQGIDGLQYKASPDSMHRLGLGKMDLELVASRTLEALNEIFEMFGNA